MAISSRSWIVGLFFILLATSSPVFGLNDAEIQSLEEMLQELPALESLSPPWTRNVSQACDGPGFYGITCSNGTDPHVIGINFTSPILSGGFIEAVEGLTFLEFFWLSNTCIYVHSCDLLSSSKKLKIFWYEHALSCSSQSASYMPQGSSYWPDMHTFHVQAVLTRGLPSLKFAGDLRHLHIINNFQVLSNKAPTGRLPFSVRLPQLESLILRNTALTGFNLPTPSYALRFPNLTLLDLQGSSNLDFNVNELLNASVKLESLNLKGVAASGSLDLILALPRLTQLRISAANIFGSFDNRFWKLRDLEVIEIGEGLISFHFSKELGKMINLRELIVRTRSKGHLHPSIVNCTKLEILEIPNLVRSGSLPSEITQLPNLRILSISSKGGPTQTIWPSFGKMTKLESLVLSSNQFNGTIPTDIANLKSLSYLDLSQNFLTGPIPNLQNPGMLVNLGLNRLSGTIPETLTEQACALVLNNNDLGPDWPSNIANNSIIEVLDLSFNKFASSVTTLPKSKFLRRLSLSVNNFRGEVRSVFCGIPEVELDNNQFSGNLSAILSARCNITTLKLNDNILEGTIPSLFANNVYMRAVDVSNNFLEGTIPALPRGLVQFSAAANRLEGRLTQDFLDSVQMSATLKDLDLSENQLECPEDPAEIGRLFFSALQHLSLSQNKFNCPLRYSAAVTITKSPWGIEGPGLESESSINPASSNYSSLSTKTSSSSSSSTSSSEFSQSQTSSSSQSSSGALPTHRKHSYAFGHSLDVQADGHLYSLDLSHNQFFGDFYDSQWTTLLSLNLAHNNFTGHLADSIPETFPMLTNLDISFNTFFLAANEIAFLPRLYTLNVQSNLIYGTLTLKNLPSLQTADFSSNQLGAIDVRSIGRRFASHTLHLLSIADQPFISTVDSTEFEQSNLIRTQESAPSQNVTGAICFGLEYDFNSPTHTTFIFDEHLFNYEQCQCDDHHFGLPLSGCSPCPGNGISVCAANVLNVSRNWYTFPVATYSNGSFILETESCIYTPAQDFTQTTNCQGLWFQEDINSYRNLSIAYKEQCRTGSEGRLCSKCSCNSDKCYFMSGTVCHQCAYLASAGATIGISLSVALALVIILTVIMLLVLRSKRKKTTARWENLPVLKRFLYRLHHLTSLGHITILITFLQLSSELTHWDSYILKGMLRALNGTGEGLGITCILPFLSDPLIELISKLMLPVIMITIVGLSVGLAELLSRILFKNEDEKTVRSEDEAADVDASDVLLLKKTGIDHVGRYPATALFTSVSISVIRFFYFGTALAAHEYIFSSLQPHTETKYVKNQPWMRYNDAFVLIGVSIPAIFVYDFVLPILFLFLCWKLRRYLKDERVQRFMGSLFENFSQKCFWWEIVNILRKLWIALILQGIAATNSTQSTLVVTLLVGTLVTQTVLMPWKRKSENLVDSISAALLLGSLHAVSSGSYSSSKTMAYLIGVLNAVFFFGVVGIIVFETIFGKTAYQKRESADYDYEYESTFADLGFMLINPQKDGNATQGDDFSAMKSGLFTAPHTSCSVTNSEDDSM